MCGCVCMYMGACVTKAERGFQMKMDLQGFVSPLMQVLETERGLCKSRIHS